MVLGMAGVLAVEEAEIVDGEVVDEPLDGECQLVEGEVISGVSPIGIIDRLPRARDAAEALNGYTFGEYELEVSVKPRLRG